MKPSFTHCALHVRDLDESIAFYRAYCGLEIVKQHGEGQSRVAWLASPGEAENFVLVLLGGGPARGQDKEDMTHYGFGVPRREDVDTIAGRARKEGILHREPRDYAPPTGYLCGVRDPSGYIVEFSHGQPLGPHQD
ncbi:MAG TPA: VOC family protein [Methyloceanibacter sp.]|jgi:catechol 2,3-dioxygenase-like lactoylglutathione lyase family enzyme|nr:VOC family protein [Methyloceanibacter sp.]